MMEIVYVMENRRLCTLLEREFAGEVILWKAQDQMQLLEQLKTEPADLVIWDLAQPGACDPSVLEQLKERTQRSLILFADEERVREKLPVLVPAVDYLQEPYSQLEAELTLVEALYQCRKRSAEEKEEEDIRTALIREKIEHYIRTHYGENLSMQDVAQAMNYSETHFCRLFKTCFKVNFSVYLNEFRVEQAKQMLRNTNLNVKEIGLRCGYRDTSYFIRVFKRFADTTPMDYRIYVQSMSRKKYNES